MLPMSTRQQLVESWLDGRSVNAAARSAGVSKRVAHEYLLACGEAATEHHVNAFAAYECEEPLRQKIQTVDGTTAVLVLGDKTGLIVSWTTAERDDFSVLGLHVMAHNFVRERGAGSSEASTPAVKAGLAKRAMTVPQMVKAFG